MASVIVSVNVSVSVSVSVTVSTSCWAFILMLLLIPVLRALSLCEFYLICLALCLSACCFLICFDFSCFVFCLSPCFLFILLPSFCCFLFFVATFEHCLEYWNGRNPHKNFTWSTREAHVHCDFLTQVFFDLCLHSDLTDDGVLLIYYSIKYQSHWG